MVGTHTADAKEIKSIKATCSPKGALTSCIFSPCESREVDICILIFCNFQTRFSKIGTMNTLETIADDFGEVSRGDCFA